VYVSKTGIELLTHQNMSSSHFKNAKNAPKLIVRKVHKKSVLTHLKMSLTHLLVHLTIKNGS
jgi:hypothetical protein